MRLKLVTFAPALAAVSGLAFGSGLWSRDSASRVVRFSAAPERALGSWKVWLKTGPGKASSLRGTTDIVAAKDTSPGRFARYDQDIRQEESIYGIPSALMHAIIQTESDFDPFVVSSAGARGLMQLMPATAQLMGVTDAFEPHQSIMGGARYLQTLARRFCRTSGEQGTTCSGIENVKVVAAYHAGPQAVVKYGGLPPYVTTRAYVITVLRRYDEWSRGGAGASGVSQK